MNEEITKLENLIKSKVSIDAIQHVIERAVQFNEEYFPVKIKLIGIGGSSVRDPRPRDIDIIAEIEKIKERWEEWQDFIKILCENNWRLYNMTTELNKEGERASIDKIIERDKKKLLELGFSQKWIEKWLRWVRIADIKWGLDRGLPTVCFSEKELVSRFLKSGWKRKRLEIHIYKIADIPFVAVWNTNRGILTPNRKEIEKFLQKEHEELVSLSNTLLEIIKSKEKFFSGIPPVYNDSLYLLTQESKKDEIFRNTREKLRKIAFSKINEIKKLLKKGYSIETNTKLRETLKQFYLVGLVYKKITNDIFKLLEILREGKNFTEVLSSRIKITSFSKKDIYEILGIINVPLLEDVQTFEQYLRRKEWQNIST